MKQGSGDIPDSLPTLIVRLLDYQERLVELARQCGAGSSSLLEALPPYGTLADRRTIWGFSRHGSGVQYVDIRSLIVVDFEIEPDDPTAFTEWRLRIFAHSLGVEELMDEFSSVNGSLVVPVRHGSSLFRLVQPVNHDCPSN